MPWRIESESYERTIHKLLYPVSEHHTVYVSVRVSNPREALFVKGDLQIKTFEIYQKFPTWRKH